MQAFGAGIEVVLLNLRRGWVTARGLVDLVEASDVFSLDLDAPGRCTPRDHSQRAHYRAEHKSDTDLPHSASLFGIDIYAISRGEVRAFADLVRSRCEFRLLTRLSHERN